ncbi:hypothetical protein SDC9_154781 [bioreactor metagenome]|uniref:Uncharacterized protein n=1 Tax=bioreactor metagenome TaxID=1076179 RepID=A0A645EZP6_9ZZZZ
MIQTHARHTEHRTKNNNTQIAHCIREHLGAGAECNEDVFQKNLAGYHKDQAAADQQEEGVSQHMHSLCFLLLA